MRSSSYDLWRVWCSVLMTRQAAAAEVNKILAAILRLNRDRVAGMLLFASQPYRSRWANINRKGPGGSSTTFRHTLLQWSPSKSPIHPPWYPRRLYRDTSNCLSRRVNTHARVRDTLGSVEKKWKDSSLSIGNFRNGSTTKR